MTIAEFLTRTAQGKLSLDEQKEYLADNPFPPVEEIAEAVEYLYGQMSDVPDLPDAIDICGTGGSGLPRLNVSTISAFIIAATGTKVAKHGNNAASGKFGSFDLLDALDVPINLSVQELQLRFNEYNLAFLYAKSFHPIMRFFAPVRGELKTPTFFNILGPLLSPVKANRQLIGTPRLEYARIIAEVSKILGKERVIVAVGSDGLDEVTLTGVTHIVELKDKRIEEYEITPADFGVEPIADFSEISTESPEHNIEMAKLILSGKEKGKLTQLVLVNAALALYIAEVSDDLKECYKLAKDTLDSGKAQEVLANYLMPSVLKKIIERDAKRDFSITEKNTHKPKKYTGGLIAEVKRSSPSEGVINDKLDIVAQAKLYENSGASAISVLTEPEDFGGSFEDLKEIKQAVNIPVLCKDFIVRKEHIDKAKACGADMVLLIAATLSEDKLKKLYDYAKDSGLQSIVEVHTGAELEKALKLKPEIIGVNSRNLHDFSLHPDIFGQLLSKLPANTIKIAESGISGYGDVPKGYDGILVGTELMKHPFPQLKIKELLGQPLVKMCGIRETNDAKLCEELGVDMIGINFAARSKRKVTAEQGKKIAAVCKNTIPVGIFENQMADEANLIAEQTGIQAMQLSGNEKDLSGYNLPIIKTIRLGEDKPEGAFLTILDSPVAGSGEKIDHSKINKFEPNLIAGGVDLNVAKTLLSTKNPLGIDTASGIETNGKVDPTKIKSLQKLVSTSRYDS